MPASTAALDRSALALRAGELVAVFVLLPLAVRLGLLPGPRLLVLAVATAGALLALRRDPGFELSRLWAGPRRDEWRGLLLRSALAAVAVALLVRWLEPLNLLATPRHHLGLWLAGLALYPLLSAWPQEVLYRAFFFRRYAPLFGEGRRMVAASGVAFAALHLVYPNLVAPLLSLPAGLVLAWRYRRTGALGPVWLEHSLYGLALFTLGLGGFFYDGRG
jgi:membrane protease YdiL (CAAX protease family)